MKEKLLDAIFQVLGVKLENMREKNKNSKYVNARIIYCFHAINFQDVDEIAEVLNTTRSSVYNYIRLYKEKYNLRPFFKLIANEVEHLILES